MKRLALSALLFLAMVSCAGEGVTKTGATKSLAIGTGVTALLYAAGGAVTAGWAWLAGIVAGFVGLFFSDSVKPGSDNGPAYVPPAPSFSIPWWLWIVAGLIVYFVATHPHLWALLRGAGRGVVKAAKKVLPKGKP